MATAVSSTFKPAKYRISTDPLLLRIELGEAPQRLIYGQDLLDLPGAVRKLDPGDLDLDDVAGPFRRGPRPRVVDQNGPHHLSRHTQEVGAILPVGVILSSQPKVGFVN
jgi:hypothetical protein